MTYRRRCRRAAAVLVAALALLAAACLVAGPKPASADDEDAQAWAGIVVLHTNDVHGNVLPRTPALAQVDAKGDVGGLAALSSWVAKERADAQKRGDGVLLLDGGDVWRGTPEGDLTHGDLVVEAFGRLRYDAVAFGNHELDMGVDNAARLAKAAKFPWLSANVLDAESGNTPSWLAPSAVVVANGIRVGIVGLSPPDTDRMVAPEVAKALRFDDPVASAKSAIAALADRADVTILLTHLGPERDMALLDALPSVRLVVGGHSHTRIAKPLLAGPQKRSWIVQAGTACVVAGRVRLRVHRTTHEVALDAYELVPLVVERVGSDDAMASLLRERTAAIPELAALAKPIGRLAKDLARAGADVSDSSAAGNLVTDAMRAAVPGADVALFNRGGIRVTLPAGPVTAHDLYLLMPFDDRIVERRMSGAALREAVAFSIGGARLTSLEASGLSARWRMEGTPPAGRVEFTRFEVGGKPLDVGREYRVLVSSFLAKGGDGYHAFTGSQTVHDVGVRDAIRAWFERAPETVPDGTPRLHAE